MADVVGVSHVANLALGAALVLLGLAAPLLKRAGPARWLLAAYLALVGFNYSADAVNYLLGAKDTLNALDHVAAVARLLDPPTLFLFALVAAGLAVTPARVLLAYAPAAALYLGGLASPGRLDARAGYALFVLLAYLAAFGVLAWRYLRETTDEGRERTGVLVGAFSVVCLTRVPLLYVDLGLASYATGRASPATLWMEASLVATFAIFALAMRRRAWPHARPLLLVVGGLLAAVDATWLLRFVPVVREAAFSLLYSVRWLLFLAVVAAGLRRHEVLGIPAAAAPWLRRASFALLLVVVAGLTASFVARSSDASGAASLAAGGLVGALVGSAVVALRVAAPPLPDEAEWRRAAIYRARVATGASRDDLDATRRRLGLSLREARRIETTAAPGLAAERYRVDRLIGCGGFGRAYLATDRVLGERVVLKELLPAWAGSPDALARFRREAEIALRIRHPNLVEFRGFEGDALVLAYVEGETLAAHLARGPLREDEALRLARGLLLGLAELHARGIVHRDVKPENVVLRADGEPVLLDFGAAAAPGSGTVAEVGAPGTPGYASPEQARGEPATPASDVYSVGVVLWRALSGGHAPPAGRVPDAWAPLLRAATAERATDRPRDARAFLERLPIQPLHR